MRKVTRATVSLLVSLAGAACAQEPIFIPPEQTVAAGNGATTGTAGDGGGSTGDGGSDATTTSTTSGGDGGAGAEGGGLPGVGGGETTADIALTIDGGTPTIELRDSATVTLTITADGDVGPVALAVEGLPDDITATLDDEMPTIVEGSQTIDVELASASNTETGSFAFTVRAVAPSGDATANGVVTVEPVLTIVIPQGLATFDDDAQPDTTAFGDYPTRIRAVPDMSSDNPVTILFFNADSVPNEIHADRGDVGFGHGQGPIPAGEMDSVVRAVSAPGTYDYYPHNIGQSILGRIIIE